MRDQPTEEVKSLVGKIDKTAMGQSISRNKPKKSQKKTIKENKEWELKGGNIL